MLAELHGENPKRIDLLLMYATGIAGAAAIIGYGVQQSADYTWWQWLVLGAISLDIIAGAVANMTRSTSIYYRRKPINISYAFLAIHFVHPLLMGLAIDPGNLIGMLVLYVYALVSGVIVLRFAGSDTQKPLASALIVTGIILHSLLFRPIPILGWFAPVYLVKLVGGFAVTHYPSEE